MTKWLTMMIITIKMYSKDNNNKKYDSKDSIDTVDNKNDIDDKKWKQ
jgi:hypothetical protein